MLRFGRELNPRWDDARASRHLDELRISLSSRIDKLSGGQRAQVAVALCLAKRPELLLLDEPVAALDPLARDELMHILLESVTDDATTVLLSSHAVSDLATVCDFVIILSSSRVRFAGELDEVFATHRLLVGPANTVPTLDDAVVISSVDTGRQSTLLVRGDRLIVDPSWEVLEPTLEEIVLAYLREDAHSSHAPEEPRYRRRRGAPNSIRTVQ
jgi:ABC-2 type transport system ATP-binding protein